MWLFSDKGINMQAEISELKRRVTDAEDAIEGHGKALDDVRKFEISCESKHREHHQYRRSTDSKLEGTNAVLSEILDILKEFKEAVPTIRRTKDNYTTIDTIIRWGGGVTILIGAYLAIKNML